MKHVILIFAAAIMIGNTACRKVNGEGPVVTETRNLTGFNGLSVALAADVVYRQSPAYQVELRAQRNILDKIETNIVSGELRIRTKENVRLHSYDRPVIYISSPDVYSLSLSGSGKMDVNDPVATDRLRLAISGSGSLTVDSLTVTNNIESVISGSGNVTVRRGVSATSEIIVSGSGKNNLEGVATNTARVNISGSGDVRIHPRLNLDVRISGSGSVFYHGSPVISSNISGSGKLIKL